MELRNHFYNFCLKNKLLICWIAFLAVACYGFEITNFTMTIDEEIYLNFKSSQNPISNLQIGRFVIWFLNNVLGIQWMVVPFVSTLFSVCFLALSSLIWCFNFQLVSKGEVAMWSKCLFCGFYMSVPAVIPEMMMYSSCNTVTFFALACVAVSISCCVFYTFGHKKSYFLCAVILLFSATSIYQSMVFVFITGTILINLCILLLSDIFPSPKQLVSNILKYICVFVLSIVLYEIVAVIIKSMLPPYEYLDNFIYWKNVTGFKDILDVFQYTLYPGTINGYFKNVTMGAVGFCCTVVITILFLIIETLRQKKWKSATTLILTLCFLFSAVLMNLVFGRIMPYRTMLVLLLFCGGAWFLFCNTLQNHRVLKWLACAIATIVIFQQIAILNMTFYSANVRYRYDLNMGIMILDDIIKETNELPSKPLVFLGMTEGLSSDNILRAEDSGRSYFEMNNNARILFFMNAHGYNLIFPTADLIESAKAEAVNSPNWPQEGSILVKEDKIIVKLSDY